MKNYLGKSYDESTSGSDALFVFLLFVLCVAAWITHIIVCLKTSAWGFLIAGALMFPIAIIHGLGVWIGVW